MNQILEKKNNFEKLYQNIRYSKRKNHRDILRDGFDYDVIIAGSDQIWNTDITKGLDEVYLLNFPGRFKKVAYSASLGTINNKGYSSPLFINSLNSFDSLSLREERSVEFISNLLHRKVSWCVDPTFLLDKKVWSVLANKVSRIVKDKYILLYCLQDNVELISIARHIANIYGYKLVSCNNSNIKYPDVLGNYGCGPLEFLNLIYNAEVVVTSSFHGAAFSVIFERDVRSVLHHGTGDRIVSLYKLAGLSSRVYTDYNDFLSRFDKEEKLHVDHESLAEAIRSSKKFLLDSL